MVIHIIRCHWVPLLLIQLQTEKFAFSSQPDFYAVYTPNHFGLMLYDVINYNDVTSTVDSFF